MPVHVGQPPILEIQLYGLPRDTDADVLAHKARDVAAALEEMGHFQQREHEPAHCFGLDGGKDP